MNKEIWRDIPGYEGLYQVSNFGKVKSLIRKGKILKAGTNNKKYYIVVLCKNGDKKGKTIHRLVAEAFIPNPENKPCVDHIDTNIHNNCVNNLKWCTQKENCLNPISRKNNSLSKIGHKCYLTHHTKETKLKLSKIKKGKPLSLEHRKKLSEAHMGIMKGKHNSLKGKHWVLKEGVRKWC